MRENNPDRTLLKKTYVLNGQRIFSNPLKIQTKFNTEKIAIAKTEI